MKKSKRIAADIAEVAVFVALMVAASWISIPFPIVPLTFQTVVSVLSGLLLGWKKGAASMCVYCFAGLAGLPFFTGGGGIAYVLKPSFGYIIGFIAAAAVAGAIVGNKTCGIKRYLTAAIVAFLVDYAVGIPYCIIAAKLLGVADLTKLFLTGNLIYMPKDAVLCVLAALLAKTLVPVIRGGKARI